MSENVNDVAGAARASSRGLADPFRALSREILVAAAHGSGRSTFVRGALEALSRHAGASRATLRLESDGAIRVYDAAFGPPARFTVRRSGVPGPPPRAADGWRTRLDPDGAFTTRLGSVWLGGDVSRAFGRIAGAELPPHVRGLDPTPGARAAAWIPMAVAESPLSALRLERQGPAFDRDAVRLYEATAQILAVALEEQRARWALGERIKEMSCLYAIARIAADRDAGPDTTLRRVASSLPPAWQHPSFASARVTIDGRHFDSEGFREGRDRLAAEVVSGGVRRGSVEVFYASDVPREEGESVFLREEMRLLETVAREVALLLERFRIEDDRLRLEEQLRHADRLATLGQLAAGVAHEINEPLGSILGFAQLAAKTPSIPAGAGADLEKIVRAALHARDVVRKLVQFARRDPPLKAPVPLASLVREALALVETRCARARIAVAREDDPALPDVVVDPAQIRQVVVNLVVNAVQAMPEGGRLAVRTRRDGNRAVLEVEDEGPGMAPDVLERIFVPFFTTKEVGEGTGLGLPVAHGIVTAHGGTIEAESRPGAGSVFRVRLPLEETEAAR